MVDSHRHGRGPIAYADLLVGLAGIEDPSERELVARSLCFEATANTPTTITTILEAASITPATTALSSSARPASSPKFWRAVEVEYQFDLDEVPESPLPPPDADQILGVEDVGRDESLMAACDAPSWPEIVPWSRLRGPMEQVYRAQLRFGELDVEKAVDEIGRGVALSRVPGRERWIRRPRLVIILDHSWRLIPFRVDIERVSRHLCAEYGRDTVEVLSWKDGPSWKGPREADLRRGDGVVVLGDLGYLEPEQGGLSPISARWLALGRALTDAGIGCAALVPCSRGRWSRQMSRYWHCIDWERPLPSFHVRRATPAAELERLLALMSWTVFLEFPLLRELRRLIPGADLGTEGAVWNHPDVLQGRFELALSKKLRESSERQLQSLITNAEGRELVARSFKVVRRRHCWRREIWHEEVLRLESLAPGLVDADDHDRTRVFVRKVRNALEAGGGPGLADGVDFQGWVERSISGPHARLVGAPFCNQDFGPDLRRIAELGWQRSLAVDPEAAAPPGLSPSGLTPDADQPWTRCLMLRGNRLAFGQITDIGVPVAWLEGHSRRVRAGDCWLELNGSSVWELSGIEDELLVETTGQRLVLQRIERPTWASAVGQDEHGLWATLEVGEIDQRMRWIPPGRFMMGTRLVGEVRPTGEQPSHPVTLTRGFWMADTPCTQALWLAVMGDNPSNFQGERRPVEMVSWNHVRSFLASLYRVLRRMHLLPGDVDGGWGMSWGSPWGGSRRSSLQRIALPTEAQWEYACRAGTTTERYGELDGVAWYMNNSQLQTHEVGEKQPNSLGLFDMLGNVNEWCGDWFASYRRETQHDPSGPVRGNERVSRGGSYRGPAEDIRAPCRLRSEPTALGPDLGFRFVINEPERGGDE